MSNTRDEFTVIRATHFEDRKRYEVGDKVHKDILQAYVHRNPQVKNWDLYVAEIERFEQNITVPTVKEEKAETPTKTKKSKKSK